MLADGVGGKGKLSCRGSLVHIPLALDFARMDEAPSRSWASRLVEISSKKRTMAFRAMAVMNAPLAHAGPVRD